MQAILLAGGHATRLWPITRNRPKPLLPLGDRSIFDRLLDQVEPIAEDVIVSTNAKFADAFRDAIEGRSRARLVIEKQASEAEKPGALGALFQVVQELDPSEPLLIAAGDNHYGFKVERFVKEAEDRDGPTVAVKRLPTREAATQFGVAELGEGTRIDAFHEKPENPPSRLAATALYYYPPGWDALFEAYDAYAAKQEDADALFDAPGQILEWAVATDRSVHAWPFEDAWFDIGTAQGYLDALGDVVGDRYVEGEVTDCQEGAGVYVYEDATAHRSALKDTVLLPGARVEDAKLTRCIVDANARVTNVALTDSLIGEHDELTGA